MSTLSSVVSNLVRASMGTSVPNTVSDDDLDRHVADLILKEAKQKLERYSKDGIRAYLPQPEANVPKTNKRFLSSIIRSTDDHNKTILRAQASAAQEARQERLEQEKRERRARAEEAVEAERMRRLMGRGGSEWARNWDRGSDRDRRKRERSWERRDDADSVGSYNGKERASKDDREEKRSRRHRSRSPTRERGSDSRRRHRRERPYSRSPSPARSADSSHHRKKGRREHRHSHRRGSRRPRSPEYLDDPDRDEERRKRSRNHRHHKEQRSRSPIPNRDGVAERRRSPSLSPVPPPGDIQASNSHDGRSDKDRDRFSRTPSPAPSAPSRKRSRSPSVGPSPPSEEARERTSREDELRRKLKSRNEPASTQAMSRLSVMSRTSSPAPSTVATKGKEPVQPTASSSRVRTPTLPPSPSRSSAPPAKRSRHRTKGKDAPPQPPSSPPPLPAHLPSKMDKYFDADYDPRLDVAPLAVPTIPATGLISDAEFAGWDAMLEVVRQRREDKEEKKRLDRWGIGSEKDKKKTKGAEGTSEVVDIMSIEYKKRGSVREWDLGKEGF